MGSSASKAARTAGTAARKYPTGLPATPNTAVRSAQARATPSSDPASEVSFDPATQTASSGAPAIHRDASEADIVLHERMRQLGPVQPNPTYSNSSTFNQTQQQKSARPQESLPGHENEAFRPSASAPTQSLFPSGNTQASTNPALTLLAARERLAGEAEQEFEDVGRLGRGKKGRQFLDVVTIRQVLRLRDELGKTDGEIEGILGLREGLVARLGQKGVVSGSGD